MPRILVSACLLGEQVRYDGRAAVWEPPEFWQQWRVEGRLLPFCAECAAGFPVPRPSAELQPDGRVTEPAGTDVTAAFLRGAELAWQLAHQHNIRIAVLKENSPSCGVQNVYDGTFSGRKVAGSGVVTRLLRENGVQVFNEQQLEQVREALSALQCRES